MNLAYENVETPVGKMDLVVGERDVLLFEFERGRVRVEQKLVARFGKVVLDDAVNPLGYTDRIRAYFDGELTALDELPVDPGGTTFQALVWSQLRKIPVGRTRSYAEIAQAVGRPSATRAVGAANGQNPIAVILPCHRVIGADGSLTGFGGGLDRKRWLLRHEGVAIPREDKRLAF
jgi:methylated-DNA-[protein]-cysteine S-methyltransferase